MLVIPGMTRRSRTALAGKPHFLVALAQNSGPGVPACLIRSQQDEACVREVFLQPASTRHSDHHLISGYTKHDLPHQLATELNHTIICGGYERHPFLDLRLNLSDGVLAYTNAGTDSRIFRDNRVVLLETASAIGDSGAIPHTAGRDRLLDRDILTVCSDNCPSKFKSQLHALLAYSRHASPYRLWHQMVSLWSTDHEIPRDAALFMIHRADNLSTATGGSWGDEPDLEVYDSRMREGDRLQRFILRVETSAEPRRVSLERGEPQ